MSDVTRYEVWQHARSQELWAVRIEYDTLTGLYGPIAREDLGRIRLADLMYEEHPDDLEWVVRASDHFTIVTPR